MRGNYSLKRRIDRLEAATKDQSSVQDFLRGCEVLRKLYFAGCSSPSWRSMSDLAKLDVEAEIERQRKQREG